MSKSEETLNVQHGRSNQRPGYVPLVRHEGRKAVSSSRVDRAGQTLLVEHETVYRYANPVSLGPHRMMIRPRDSHDLRLLDTRLMIEPATHVTWMHDVFGNSVGVAEFGSSADQLKITSQLWIEHYPTDLNPKSFIMAHAANYPFHYNKDDLVDLEPVLRRHYPDTDNAVESWARSHLRDASSTPTWELLQRMTQGIKSQFQYNARYEEGTQTPEKTLGQRSGTCRDFALLMMEGLRAIGLAARFVSGYLYDPDASADTQENVIGGGATHAWVEVFLPGAGWVEFDPTNGYVGGRGLIRIAVARDPSQAIPVSGTWRGAGADFLGLDVNVTVSAQ